MPTPSASFLTATGLAVLATRLRLPRWLRWSTLAVAAAVAGNEIAGKPVPFLRWSYLSMLARVRRLLKDGRIGDGREEALAEHVITTAGAGDLADAIAVVDRFAHQRQFMMNIGDDKGPILDRAVLRAQPRRLLELGTYCGYSALRIAEAMPAGAHLWSLELNPANAHVARRILRHAGVADRVTIVDGALRDTTETLCAEHGFAPGELDLVFLDHDKDDYLADLERLLGLGWLHPGSVVVADNIKFPGVPDYLAYMRQAEDVEWRTVEHSAHMEYQRLVPDLVLESEYLGKARAW